MDNSTIDRSTRVVGRMAWIPGIACAGLVVTALVTFGVAIAKTVKVVDDALSGGWRDDLVLVSLLKIIDTHLLGVVQVIVCVGLYELFIGDLPVPGWLEARSIEDLKKPIADALVLFIAIKGIESYLVADSGRDQIESVVAATLLVLGLTVFRRLTASKDDR